MTHDQDALALAERVLAILEEGSFSSTYKYALFIAILDLCIEKTDASGAPPSSLTTRELATKVVELCWNHVAPYGTHGTLRFGGGRGEQAEILRRIQEVRARWGDERSDTVFRFQTVHPDQYERLLDFVEWKLIEMPIPRLQRLGRHEDRFLYGYNWRHDIRQAAVRAYQRRRESEFDNRGLDNLVPAHGKCNNNKRDFLASADHLERWAERTHARDADLTALAQACSWPRNRDRSTAVARAVYLRLPVSARLWRGPDNFDAVDHPRIKRALGS